VSRTGQTQTPPAETEETKETFKIPVTGREAPPNTRFSDQSDGHTSLQESHPSVSRHSKQFFSKSTDSPPLDTPPSQTSIVDSKSRPLTELTDKLAGEKLLIVACLRHDLATVERLIAQGVSVDTAVKLPTKKENLSSYKSI